MIGINDNPANNNDKPIQINNFELSGDSLNLFQKLKLPTSFSKKYLVVRIYNP